MLANEVGVPVEFTSRLPCIHTVPPKLAPPMTVVAPETCRLSSAAR